MKKLLCLVAIFIWLGSDTLVNIDNIIAIHAKNSRQTIIYVTKGCLPILVNININEIAKVIQKASKKNV